MCKDLEELFQSEFQIKIMGEVKYILGMGINNDLNKHEIHMSQCKYIKQSLNDYNKYNIKVYDSPMDSRTPFSKSQCPAADSEEARLMRMMPYRELIGSLLWVRPSGIASAATQVKCAVRLSSLTSFNSPRSFSRLA